MFEHSTFILDSKLDDIGQSTLPSKKVWSEFESNRLLLEPRPQVVSTIFRLVAVAALVMFAPLIWVVAWTVLVFGSSIWMRRFIRAYAQTMNALPRPMVMTPDMHAIARAYKQAWLINSLIWGCLSFLAQMWLPEGARLVCVVVLNALMFMSITRTHISKRLMHRVSAILLISQFAFVLMRYFVVKDTELVRHDDVQRILAYAFYITLTAYLLWVVGNRFSQMHIQHLDSTYSKLQLIETLRQSQEQLHLEQQALVSANKLVQQFYSGAAHDLRQPVYAMQLYTTMLADDPTLSKSMLPKITQSCVAINDMFNTLFDYQQTHMYDTELVESNIYIKECFHSLALHFQPIATGKGLTIRFKPIPGTVQVVPLYLTRILSNLISNALRYTETGSVLVAARKKRNHICFEVWDTGLGIETPALDKIFKEFYKVISVDVNNEGLGLGLSIVKQLCARIEGADITVKSRPGRGSVFKFTMPISKFNAID
jgi:signal transduction histidine kinase